MHHMVTDFISKYNELEEDFFSNGTPWTYEWEFEGEMCCLDWDYDKKQYDYNRNYKFVKSFKSIYEALDGIMLGKRTLRQMLLETNFQFLSIM